MIDEEPLPIEKMRGDTHQVPVEIRGAESLADADVSDI